MRRESSGAQARAVAFIIVAALHIGVIVTFAMIKSTPIELDQGGRTEFFIFAPDRNRELTRGDSRQRVEDTRHDQINAPSPPTIVAIAPPPLAPTEWEEQGRRAVRSLAESKQGESLSGVKREPPDVDGASVFKRPFHERGDSQQLGNGEVITWIDSRNGRCYVTNQPSAVARIDERNIVVICKPADTPIDASLFEAIKPSYLRKTEK